jgi:hypothetical protein
MGQYYKPVILDDENNIIAWAYTHDFKEEWTDWQGRPYMSSTGLKLMEHSWLANGFVNGIERLLIDGGEFHKRRIVWAGDYAEPEPGKTYQWEKEIWESGRVYKSGEAKPTEIVTDDEANLYHLAFDDDDYEVKQGRTQNTKVQLSHRKLSKKFRYICNYDKRQYVDKQHVRGGTRWDDDGSVWLIHPLPLMTCEGNGQGGGDFFGPDPKGLVGCWARDHIGIETKVPAGFTEVIFDLSENIEPTKELPSAVTDTVITAGDDTKALTA